MELYRDAQVRPGLGGTHIADEEGFQVLVKIKEEVERLLEAGFIQTCRYAEWISSIVPIEKKNTDKIRVCVDFHDLNRATPKDEYPMPVAEDLINKASCHKMISFLDGNVGYN
jgi:hypothetical protein